LKNTSAYMNRSRHNAPLENAIKKWILAECGSWYDETYTSIRITTVKQYRWSRHYLIRLDGPSGMPFRTVLAKVLRSPGAHERSQGAVRPAMGAIRREFEALSVLYRSLGEGAYHGLTAIRPLGFSSALNLLALEYAPGRDLLSGITHGLHLQAPVCRLTGVVESIREAGRLLAVFHRAGHGAYLRCGRFNEVEFLHNLRSEVELVLQKVRTNAARERLRRIIKTTPEWRLERDEMITISRLHRDYYPDNVVQLPGGEVYTIDTTMDQEGPVEDDIAKFIIGAWVTKKALLLRHGWLNTQALRMIQLEFLDGYATNGTCNSSILALSVLGSLLRRWLEVYGVLLEKTPRTLADLVIWSRIEPALVHCLDVIMRDIELEIGHA
jgi:hypothetical protein